MKGLKRTSKRHICIYSSTDDIVFQITSMLFGVPAFSRHAHSRATAHEVPTAIGTMCATKWCLCTVQYYRAITSVIWWNMVQFFLSASSELCIPPFKIIYIWRYSRATHITALRWLCRTGRLYAAITVLKIPSKQTSTTDSISLFFNVVPKTGNGVHKDRKSL